MGITVSRVDDRPVGNQRVVFADVTFDGSYTSGGETLAAADLGLDSIDAVTIASGLTSGGLPVGVDTSGPALVVYDGTHSEQSAGAAAVDGETVRVRVRGRS